MTEHVSGRRRAAVGLAAAAVGAIGLIGAFPSAAGATGGPGHDGGRSPRGGMPEHPCPDEGWDFHWGPDNQDDVPGTHTDGDFTVTIDNVRTENDARTFDFETSEPVEFVYAVGWPNRDEGETFTFDPPATSGTAFTGDPEYIKHVYFCPPEVDDTTTTSSSTTSSSTTSTTEEPTTTSSTETPPSSETPTTAPPTSVEPTPPSTETPTTTAPGGELPRTGSNSTMPLVAAGGALVAAGVAFVAGRRFLQNRAAS
ncbi:MAG TPA: LPXTG cell wall anchor domain-containing protein [Acidimicrobiales bacterium]